MNGLVAKVMVERKHSQACGGLVRTGDPDRFFGSRFYPQARRGAVLALYGFDLEIGKTAQMVSEPMLGHIRLQWWRETVDEIYAGTVKRHEVVEPLAAAIAAHNLPAELFIAAIDGRRLDVDADAVIDRARLVDYAARTRLPILQAACRIAGEDDTAADVVPVLGAAAEVQSALDLLLRSGGGGSGLCPQIVRSDIFQVLGDGFGRVRSGFSSLPDGVLPVVLHLAAAPDYIRALGSGAGRGGVNPVVRQGRMVWAYLRKRL